MRRTVYPNPPQFQSTPPAWGATRPANARATYANDFNPRSPHGERLLGGIIEASDVDISIHAPRMGSDKTFFPHSAGASQFQSTLPAWGATGCVFCAAPCRCISIHAPRMGSDFLRRLYQSRNSISIHAPRMGSDRVVCAETVLS